MLPFEDSAPKQKDCGQDHSDGGNGDRGFRKATGNDRVGRNRQANQRRDRSQG